MPLTELEMAELSEEQARKRLYSILDWLWLDKKYISEETYNNIWQDIHTLIDYHLLLQNEERVWYRRIRSMLRGLIT